MTTWQDIDFTKAGALTTSAENVGRIIGLLTASKDSAPEGSLVDLDDLAALAADPEHAIAAIQFLLGIVLAALDDLESRDGLNVSRWLQRMALHYS